jgi:hypothetical protein
MLFLYLEFVESVVIFEAIVRVPEASRAVSRLGGTLNSALSNAECRGDVATSRFCMQGLR